MTDEIEEALNHIANVVYRTVDESLYRYESTEFSSHDFAKITSELVKERCLQWIKSQPQNVAPAEAFPPAVTDTPEPEHCTTPDPEICKHEFEPFGLAFAEKAIQIGHMCRICGEKLRF